jgi:hypothetical protein
MRRARQPHIAANIAKLPELSKIEEAANLTAAASSTMEQVFHLMRTERERTVKLE